MSIECPAPQSRYGLAGEIERRLRAFSADEFLRRGAALNLVDDASGGLAAIGAVEMAAEFQHCFLFHRPHAGGIVALALGVVIAPVEAGGIAGDLDGREAHLIEPGDFPLRRAFHCFFRLRSGLFRLRSGLPFAMERLQFRRRRSFSQ